MLGWRVGMGMDMGMGMGLWTGRGLDLGPGLVLARRCHGMDFPQGLGNDRADGARMGSYLRLRGIATEPSVGAESEAVPAGAAKENSSGLTGSGESDMTSPGTESGSEEDGWCDLLVGEGEAVAENRRRLWGRCWAKGALCRGWRCCWRYRWWWCWCFAVGGGIGVVAAGIRGKETVELSLRVHKPTSPI